MNLTPLAQTQAWSNLITLSKALPQGLILVGPAGVGKRRSVKALFQYLNCKQRGGAAAAADADNTGSLFGGPAPTPQDTDTNEPCGTCVMCRKIAEGQHADLIEISPKGETIPVDDLREMKKSLYFAPIEGAHRFVIIDEAHKLNASSANTLLKTLEEPPAHTRFFLITHERGLLLPTIVSRCQFVHFAPLSRETMIELLKQMNIELPQSLLPLCLDLMGGGMQRASLFAEAKTQQFLNDISGQLTALSPARAPAWDQIVQLADQLATDEWRLELFLDLMVRAAHYNATCAKTASDAQHHANRALEAARLRRRLGRYANKKLVALAAANLSADTSHAGGAQS